MAVDRAPATNRWFNAPRWNGFRSILHTGNGYLLTGIRTNVEGEQIGWAVKLDNSGDVEWNRTYQSPRHLQETDSGEDHDGIEFALPDGAGGFLLVGWWHTMGSDSRYAWLTRIAGNGVPYWSRVIHRDDVNSFRDDFAGGVRTTDGFLLVGRSIASEFLDEETGDGWVVSITLDGRVRWSRTYDPQGTSDSWSKDRHHAEFSGVARTGDGFVVVGEASPDGPTKTTRTAAWVVRIDNQGRLRWSRTHRFDRRTNNEFRDIAPTEGGFYVAGTSGSEKYDRPNHDYSMHGRAWAAKLARDGRLVWQDSHDDTSAFDGVVTVRNDAAVFVGSQDNRGFAAAYRAGGARVGIHRSSIRESRYVGVARAGNDVVAVGWGRRGTDADGLLTRLAVSDFQSDDDDNTGDDREHLLEIIAREQGDVRYEFIVDGTVKKAHVNDRVKSETNDTLTNRAGRVIVSGFTGNTGWGDAYRFTGRVLSFRRTAGNADFDLLLDGTRVTVDELVD